MNQYLYTEHHYIINHKSGFMHSELIKDRIEAGLKLSDKLVKYKNTDTVILAIPRGGVPIAYVIAIRLNLPLDIILSKKIPHPYNKEYAIGAVSLLSQTLNPFSDVSTEYKEKEIIRLRELLKDKYEYYRGDLEPIDIEGKNVIVVDDGIATGHTLLASIKMLRQRNPKSIIIAVPVMPLEKIKIFKENADDLIYLIASAEFTGVGSFYENFTQVEDEEVIRMLRVAETTQ